MVKRIFLVLTCVILIIGTTACTSGGSTPTQSAAPSSSQAPATPASSAAPAASAAPAPAGDAKYEGDVRVFSMSPERSVYWEAMADSYKAKQPDVNVVFEIYETGQYYSALSTALQANDMPEIFTSHGSKNANLLQYINAGVVLDLDPYISADDMKQFNEYLVQRAKVGGKLYSTPGSFMDIWTIFYNKAIFEQFSLTVPKTLDELVAIMDTLTANGIVAMGMPGKDVKGPATMITVVNSMLTPDWCIDFVNFKFDDNPSGRYSDPRYVEGLDMFIDWMNKGYFGTDWKGLDTNGGILEFTSGKSAMWSRGSYDKAAICANSDIEVGNFYPPTKDGRRVLISGQDNASGFSVYSKAENLDLSLDVLMHLFSAESMQIIADAGFNIPGRTDVTTNDPVFAELDNDPFNVVNPYYVDYNGALGREGLDTWVEFKNISTALAYGEINTAQFVEKLENEIISYDIRNFDPWGDGR